MKGVRLSRPARTARNLLLAALALLLWRGCLGFPAFTSMGAFRQCERRNMVDPAQVVGSLRIRNNRERLILAQDGDILEAVEACRYGFWNWQAPRMCRTPLNGQTQAIPLIWEDNQQTVLLFAVAVPPAARQVEGTMVYDPDGMNVSVRFTGEQRMGEFIIARGQIDLQGQQVFMAFAFQNLDRDNPIAAEIRINVQAT